MPPERSSSLSKDVRHPGIYNVTDSTPATQLEVYSWLADHFHRPLPSYGPADLERKRGWTNKRVCNRTAAKNGLAADISGIPRRHPNSA